jgi:hypothetical protein
MLFSYKRDGVTVSEAGVPVISGTALRMYIEGSGISGQAGSIQSGIAIANNSTSDATITLEVTGQDGNGLRGVAPISVTLIGGGQIARFLGDLFPTLPISFKGALRISTFQGGISVVGLRTRYNERGDFLLTTTPAGIENAPPKGIETNFPQVVDGGGYTTQMILFSSTASTGSLRFYRSDGQPLSLTLH